MLPPAFYAGISLPLWIAAAAVFGLLGLNLLRLKGWARTATIFVQGFSIIVRLLTLVSKVVPEKPVSLTPRLVLTSVLSMALSAVILFYVDQPDVQLLMQQ